MKKILLFIAIINFSVFQAQIVNIPDANFKTKLLNHNPIIDLNNDNEIQVTEAEVFNGSLAVSSGNISDLTGIEAFINITELNCGENNLTNLDVSSNVNLIKLWCTFNNITNLNLGNIPTLENLDFEDNDVSVINLSNNPLLKTIHCNHNLLSNLNFANQTNLEIVYCGNNSIATIDLSNNNQLFAFYCSNNNDLTYINLKNGNNDNISLQYSQTSNLPNLQTVCLDDVTSNLSTQIANQVNHSINITDNCTLSINENTFLDFSVYPTPTENILNIKSKTEIIKIKIYNKLGQLIISTTENQIDISNLTQGLYFVKVEDVNGSFSVKKIVKK